MSDADYEDMQEELENAAGNSDTISLDDYLEFD